MRKALFVGGTGTISSGVVRRLCQEGGWEVWLLNRGNRSDRVPAGVHQIIADINDEGAVTELLQGMTFDVVNEFIGFTPDQVERDWRLFRGRTRQYIFVSSASAYHKPAAAIGSPRERRCPTPTGLIPGTRSPAKSSSWTSTGRKGSP